MIRPFLTPLLSAITILVGASQPTAAQGIAKALEQHSAQAYSKLIADAAQKGQLVSESDPTAVRLREVEQRLLPNALRVNQQARQWDWQVNLINSPQINAFCMPGGKIAFYTALITQLQLSNDEIAIVMGHEMTHALREHGVDQYKKQMMGQLAERAGVAIASQYFNFNPQLLGAGAQILDKLAQLRFSRKDETEADRIGLEIAARSGFDPRAGISLWNKMDQASRGANLEFLSSHPGGPNRIRAIQAQLPDVLPLYQATLQRH
ncbi:MAG: M48 family metallopeptidase [Burkholderiaceae bacterium]